MKKIILLIFLTVVYLPAMGQDDAREILNKAIGQLLTVDMEMTMEVEETDPRGRVKEKSFDILMAKFGEVEKARMTMQKPDRARGITIVFTHLPDEVGIIEVFTPANGKTRMMRATSANMDRVGSNFSLSNYASTDYDDLDCKLLGKEEIDGKSCYRLEVIEQADSVDLIAEFMVEESTFHIVQIQLFDKNGINTSTTRLSNFQAINGLQNKIHPMLILAEDMASSKQTRMQVLNVSPRPGVKEEDFRIQGTIE